VKKRTGYILMVDDEVDLLRLSESILRREGHRVQTSANPREALALLEQEDFDVVLLDLRMPEMDGLEFLSLMKGQKKHRAEVVVLTAYSTVDSAVKAMKLGARGYVSKPFNPDEVLAEIDQALEVQELRVENKELRRQKGKTRELVGQHPKMQQALQLIRDIAPTSIPVLIRGESGTGKELVAEAIHRASPRAAQSFIRCNCAAFAPGVLESELFGHVKGAFTGAVKDRQGRFEEADGGTLFLDEVGDLSLEAQVRLLRVVQEQEFEPVGSTQTRKVDVRIITATHQDLEKAMQEGRFREDLFYRISGRTIELPPLRERKGDIPVLCEHLIKVHAELLHKEIDPLSPEVLSIMEGYEWPGNVRELENEIMGAIALAKEGEICLEHLEFARKMAGGNSEEVKALYVVPAQGFHEACDQFEAQFIRRVLHRSKGNISQAAQMMRIGRRELQRKISQHKIEVGSLKKKR
jgi:two-component system NtrC family response regulator